MKARTIVDQKTATAHGRNISLQLELVRCGAQSCRSCPHGPYWYGYWKEPHPYRRSRLCTVYVGRDLRRLEAAVARKLGAVRAQFEEERRARLNTQPKKRKR